MQILLPPDAQQGQTLQVNVNGQMMAVVVPPGAQPGGSMIIQVPSGGGLLGGLPTVQAHVADPNAVVMGIAL